MADHIHETAHVFALEVAARQLQLLSRQMLAFLLVDHAQETKSG